MIKEKIGYSYNDLTIIPKRISDIKSRSECNPFLKEGNLPIFTAPMSTVVNLENIQTFKDNRIIPILPRNINIKNRIANLNVNWVALSLNEFEEVFINNWDKYLKLGQTYKVCVDIANGHMYSLYQKCQKAKNIAEKNNYALTIMTGNIANPATYKLITEFITNSGNTVIDYIRLSVGSGSQCLTASNVATHYPIASLIDECVAMKPCLPIPAPKIIADGGIKNYSDVIKALALGADYVMIGGLFAGMYESASPLLDASHKETYMCKTEEDKRKQIESCYLSKECYGMSTKKAQNEIGKSNKTSEGKHSYIPVKYTLSQWTENMIDYLKSAMSYCNSRNIIDFIGNQTLIVNSIGEINAVNK